jgi:phospholipid transport system substrate-binding protein
MKHVVAAFLLIAALLGLNTTAAKAEAPPTAAAEAFVDTMGQKAIQNLADNKAKGGTKDDLVASFRGMLQTNFDLPTIARFALGRYWRVATPDQQQEYLKLFEDMILGIYSDRFAMYSGETFKTSGAQIISDRDTLVTSEIKKDGGPLKVEWRVRAKEDGSFRVLDVIVEGVSMSISQRDDFAAVIQRSGGKIEGLLAEMKKRVSTGDTTTAGNFGQKAK